MWNYEIQEKYKLPTWKFGRLLVDFNYLRGITSSIFAVTIACIIRKFYDFKKPNWKINKTDQNLTH